VALVANYRGRVTTVSGTGNADSSPVSVNAGDMLVVAVIADSYQDLTHANVTMTWPDSRGFTYWTEHAFWGNSFDGCYTQIAAYRCPAAGNPGIHVVTSGSAQGHRRPSFEIWTISGADASSPVPGSDNRDAFGNPMSLTLHSVAGTAGDTIAIICGADGFGVGDPYVSGDGITPGNGYTQPSGGGEPGISGFSTAASWHTPDTNQSLVIDPPGGSMAVYAVSWMEFQASRTAPVVNAGTDASYTFGSGGGTFTRTATEAGGIASRQWTIQSGPAGAGTTIGTAAALSWSPTVAGVYVLRYSATNAFGTGTDDVTVTVVGTAPVVDAGLDRTVERTLGIIRTAGESSTGGSTITARQWRLMSGPAGSGAPVNLAAYGGDPARCLLPSTVTGAHVIRYTATNATGAGYDEATITVTAKRPTVNAGPDEARGMGLITRTAQETAGDNAITSRQWKIQDGPSAVGTVIGSAAALSWTPPSLGRWVLRYTATSAAGTSDPDDAVLTIGVSGAPLRLGRTPEPKLAVTIAFAGDLTDPDGSSWVFTEVTADVRVAQGVYLRHGRSDEASVSQPAQCRFTLDNRTGRYSLGGRSPYWPNVRQGVPVQVQVDLGSGFQTLFTGYADGFSPGYSTEPLSGERGDATVTVSASGSMRRLTQGSPVAVSPMRRSLVAASGVIAYWPCEDDAQSTSLASALPGAPPMTYNLRLHPGSNPGLAATPPRLAESSVFGCSDPLPLVTDSEWYGSVPAYTSTGVLQLRFLLAIPAAGTWDGDGNGTVLIGLINDGGDPWMWELRYKRTGFINVRAWRPVLGGPVLDLDVNFGMDGKLGQFGLTLTQNGSAIDWVVDWVEVGASVVFVYSGSLASSTLGRSIRVQTSTDGGNYDVTMGHIVLRTAARNNVENANHVNAYAREAVGNRLVRTANENVLWYNQIDLPLPHVETPTDLMGPQIAGTVLDQFRDGERTDCGLLWDGVGPGLNYTTKRYRESRGTAALVLDATTGALGVPFQPVHDDAYRCNRAVVERKGGSSAVSADTTGPLGTGLVGRYDDSFTVNVHTDQALPLYASWAVFQGTVEGYRYPRLALDLTARPDLIDEWLTVRPGDRIDITNLRTITSAAEDDVISLAVEGYEQTITPYTWAALVNTSLWRRWQVAAVCTATGDTSDFAARADTTTTVVTTLTTVGTAALPVTVSAGPPWTTAADDYPLYLDVAGVRVRATGVTAPSGANQTFTTDALPVTIPAGTAVQLWRPAVLGL
jgi:hypothetical protein